MSAVVFLISFEFHRKETVRGYITSSTGVIVLRAHRGGRLVRLHVAVGDYVEAGQVVLEATTDIESASGMIRGSQLATTNGRLAELNAQTALVSRSAAERRRFLTAQEVLLAGRIDKLRDQRALRQQILDLSQQTLARITDLQSEHFASEQEAGRQAERVLANRSDVASAENAVAEIESRVRALRFELNNLKVSEAKQRSELRIRKAALEQSRLEQVAQGSYLVRSPVAGRISAISASVGQELAARSSVATLIPAGSTLVANLFAPSRAIAFLQGNARVDLLIDAFPYQSFGAHSGRIREISRSSYKPGDLSLPFRLEESAYKVTVDLERDHVSAYGQEYPLRIDMTLTGDLIVERRSLIGWVLDPLLSARL